MIDHSEASVSFLSIHQVSNIDTNELYQINDSPVRLDDVLSNLLLRYFCDNFKAPVFYQFDLDGVHPISNFIIEIFEDPTLLHDYSKEIANQLQEKSVHPFIKYGDLLIGYVKDLVVDDEMSNAIVIIKSETKNNFLKILGNNLESDSGIPLNLIDKACLIFESEANEGYKILSIDKSNASEAKYWNDDFLKLKERTDDYHLTKNYMLATQTFVKEKLTNENDVGITMKNEILDQSKAYFSNNEEFSQSDFEQTVFRDEGVYDMFQNFKSEANNPATQNLVKADFKISDAAYNKYSKIYKSVIKLDKNFHIYVHGNRNLISKEVDENGRNYYKLYFETES